LCPANLPGGVSKGTDAGMEKKAEAQTSGLNPKIIVAVFVKTPTVVLIRK
jgi:hypothetical protein